MFSKDERNIEICKIHYKRKEERKEKGNRIKMLAAGCIIAILLTSVALAVADVTETGTWQFGAVLNIPPKEILNNVWGAPYNERQSGTLKSYIYYKSGGSSFGWEWDRPSPVPVNGYVQPIYPEVLLDSDSGILPIKLIDINSLSAELQYTYVKQPTGSYNLAYDIWFDQYDERKAEIMVWISCTAECAPGTYAGEIDDGYNTYKVYYTNPSSWRPWLYYAFILKNQNPVPLNHSVDIKALLNSISNKLDNNWELYRLDLGNEIWKGSGRIEISKLNINLNSQTNPTPTVTPTPTATAVPTVVPTPTTTTHTPIATPTPTATAVPTVVPTPTITPISLPTQGSIQDTINALLAQMHR